MTRISLFTIIGGILLVLVAILLLIGQDGCEEEKVVEPKQGNEPGSQVQKGEGEVQIIVYQKGKGTKLNPKDPRFAELQVVVEDIFKSADDMLKEEVSPEIILGIKNKESAVEIVYSQPQKFIIVGYSNKVLQGVTRLLVPLTGYYTFQEKLTTIFYGYPEYSSGPFVNEKNLARVKRLLRDMNIEVQ